MEQRLRVLYGAVQAFDNLRVLCAATLCEVVGDIAVSPVNCGAVRAVQEVGRSDAIAGIRSDFFHVGAAPDGPGTTFVTYWRRDEKARSAITAPRLIATVPAEGMRIAPGPFALSLTFDRSMRGDGWSLVGEPASLPDCAKASQMSADGRTFTFTFACRAEAGLSYAIGFNGGRFRNSRSREGMPAEPHVLRLTVR